MSELRMKIYQVLERIRLTQSERDKITSRIFALVEGEGKEDFDRNPGNDKHIERDYPKPKEIIEPLDLMKFFSGDYIEAKDIMIQETINRTIAAVNKINGGGE